MAPGSLPIHDLEKAHNALVGDGRLGSEAHRADANDPVYLERMEMANDLCPSSSATFGASRDVAAEPADLPRLVRLPLPGQPGQGQMGPD